jgi:predicted PhzF superfamily epimerase YddE/YHI9
VTDLHVLRVFVAPDGSAGNPLAVFLDGSAIVPRRRQAVAAEIGLSETVFVDDRDAPEAPIAIYTPATEMRFAGHPTVGTSWLLREVGAPATALRVAAGTVLAWPEADMAWVRARPEWVHEMTLAQLASVDEVESLDVPPPGEAAYYSWAWEDETAGRVRSRNFVPGLGILEDEATGNAAVALTGQLRRPLQIRQGRGSILLTRLGPDGMVELGGRCFLDDVRSFD